MMSLYHTIMSYDIHLINYGNGFTNGNVQDEVGKKKSVYLFVDE